MANNPYAQPAPADGAEFGLPMEPARTSVLAVLSLIASLLCCVPSLGLLGVLLGVVAIIFITGSKGRLGGMGLAIAGVVIGLLVSAVWLLLAFGAITGFKEFSKTPDVLAAAQQRDLAAVHATLSADAQAVVTDELLETFASRVEAEHGSFVGTMESIGDAITAYTSLSNEFQNAYQPASQTFQLDDKLLIPVPAEFDTGIVLFSHVWPAEMDQNTPTAPNGMPVMDNFGVVASDGSWIWLYPPPQLSGSTTPATPIPPATPGPNAEEDAPAEPDADPETDAAPEPAPDQPEEPTEDPSNEDG